MAPPAPEGGDRLAAFQTFWLAQARAAIPFADDIATSGNLEIDDSRRVASLDGATAMLPDRAQRDDDAYEADRA